MSRNGTNPHGVPIVDETPTDPGVVLSRRWAGAIKTLMIIGAAAAAVVGATAAVLAYAGRFETKAEVATKAAEANATHDALKATDLDHERRMVGLERSDAFQERRLEWLNNTMWEFAKKEGLRVPPPPREEGLLP